MEGADFSGFATKAGLKCSDGRTIMPDAFKHMGGMQVPLVWQHGHNNVDNILGHAVLEADAEGHLRAFGFFNDTPAGRVAKALVMHKDIQSLSIYANQLTERLIRGAKQVLHGMIREVSLVMSGANPGAKIDFVSIKHDDGSILDLDDEAIIHTGEDFVVHFVDDSDDEDDALEHAERTVQEIYDGFSDEEKQVVHFMIGTALESAAEHSDDDNEDDLSHKEGSEVMTNVFEKKNGEKESVIRHSMTRDDVRGIFEKMKKSGGTLKHYMEEYAITHGIEDLDLLFPDAQTVDNTPQFDKRRTEWVAGVLNGTKHTPFTRIKSIVANITFEAARAKGYIKGTFKKEEWFKLTSRKTGPTTVYKKQKFDRDDLIDITTMDLPMWVKGEMRLMLEEEIARAILIGDGRAVDDEDKIKDPAGASEGEGIRSILLEHELYAATVNINIGDSVKDYNKIVEEILLARHLLKGSGTPTLYSTNYWIVRMLLSKDSLGRRRWQNKAELASALMVDTIVEVEVMEEETDLFGIIVNLQDYTIGTDKGGETNFFDDFDIDYNQMKYLYETRLSGALTKIRSALILHKVAGTDVFVTPTVPTFVSSTGVITIVATTGVTYHFVNTDGTSGSALTPGAQTALAAGASKTVRAVSASGYYQENNIGDEWTFTRDAA